LEMSGPQTIEVRSGRGDPEWSGVEHSEWD
jgi:hypothetical protein